MRSMFTPLLGNGVHSSEHGEQSSFTGGWSPSDFRKKSTPPLLGIKIFYEENLSGLIYKQNKRRCGRKELVLSEHKLEEIRCLLAQGWSLNAIAGRDRLMNHSERVSTKTLYKLLKQGIIDSNL